MRVVIPLLIFLFSPFLMAGSQLQYSIKFCEEGVFEETAFIALDQEMLEGEGLDYSLIYSEIGSLAQAYEDYMNTYRDNDFKLIANKITQANGHEGVGLIVFFQSWQEYNRLYDTELMNDGGLIYDQIDDDSNFFYKRKTMRANVFFETNILMSFLNDARDILYNNTEYFDSFANLELKFAHYSKDKNLTANSDETMDVEGYTKHIWTLDFDELEDFQVVFYKNRVLNVWVWYLTASLVSLIFMTGFYFMPRGKHIVNG